MRADFFDRFGSFIRHPLVADLRDRTSASSATLRFQAVMLMAEDIQHCSRWSSLGVIGCHLADDTAPDGVKTDPVIHQMKSLWGRPGVRQSTRRQMIARGATRQRRSEQSGESHVISSDSRTDASRNAG